MSYLYISSLQEMILKAKGDEGTIWSFRILGAQRAVRSGSLLRRKRVVLPPRTSLLLRGAHRSSRCGSVGMRAQKTGRQVEPELQLQRQRTEPCGRTDAPEERVRVARALLAVRKRHS
jgi:hypothetical protein